jgi:hypothetical protein
MEEIQQQMWDEGDLFRQRAEEGFSQSLGSLVLGQQEDSERKRTKRLTANESKVAEEGDLGQGERLRAMRAKHAGGRIQDDTAWRREEDARLSRK